jgi:hypothetical protein
VQSICSCSRVRDNCRTTQRRLRRTPMPCGRSNWTGPTEAASSNTRHSTGTYLTSFSFMRVSCVSCVIIQHSFLYLYKPVYHKIQTHRDRSLFGGVSQAEGEERESHLPTPEGQGRQRRGWNAEAERPAAQAAHGTEVPPHYAGFPLPGISACSADPLCVWYGVHRSLGSASDEEEEELVECTFTTVKEFSNSATLFTVHPLGATIVRGQRPSLLLAM